MNAGEGAERLDLVAEELDADRLATGRREDVHDPAADGDLARAPRPARRGRSRRAPAARRGPPRPARRRRRAVIASGRWSRGGSAFGTAERRRAHESAAREDLERARPLADEVRRRLEPALPPDAARREQPDVLLPEEPGGRLGGVAGVRVVRRRGQTSGPGARSRSRRGRAAGAARTRVPGPGWSTNARSRSLSASSRASAFSGGASVCVVCGSMTSDGTVVPPGSNRSRGARARFGAFSGLAARVDSPRAG